MSLGVIASGNARTEFVDINVASWAWLATIGVIVALCCSTSYPQPPRACTDTATGGDGNRRVGRGSGRLASS